MEVILEAKCSGKNSASTARFAAPNSIPWQRKACANTRRADDAMRTPGVISRRSTSLRSHGPIVLGELAVGGDRGGDIRYALSSRLRQQTCFCARRDKLVEVGTLALDTDVNNYLKSWQVPANDGWQPRCTPAAFSSYGGNNRSSIPWLSARRAALGVSQILQGEPPSNTAPILVDILPGTQFRYSGGGTTDRFSRLLWMRHRKAFSRFDARADPRSRRHEG